MPIPNAYDRMQQRRQQPGIVGNRYAPGAGNVAAYPPGMSYGPPQGGQTLDWNQQQLLLAQREREQMLPIVARLQEGREQRDLDWATTAARLNQDWATGGRQLEFQSQQGAFDRLLRELMQDKELQAKFQMASQDRSHQITMADLEDALARRRQGDQNAFAKELQILQQGFTGGENQLNRMQQERLQTLGHDQSLSRDDHIAALQKDRDALLHSQTLQRDDQGFGRQKDILGLGHTQALERLDVGHKQTLERDDLGFGRTLEQMRYGDELATGRFEQTTEKSYLVQQELELQAWLKEQSAVYDRMDAKGKAAFDKFKVFLSDADKERNLGHATDNERLQARAKAFDLVKQHNWAEYVAKPGTLPGDTVKEGGQVFRLGADGSRERVGPDYEMRSTPEGRKKYEAMIAPIALRDEYGNVIGYEVEGGRGREILQATSGTGTSAGGRAIGQDGQPIDGLARFFNGDPKRTDAVIENVRAELMKSRGWLDTRGAVKFGVLERAEFGGNRVDWATEMTPADIEDVMQQQADSIRTILTERVNPTPEFDNEGKPVRKPGTAVTLPGVGGYAPVVIQPGADGAALLDRIPDSMLREHNKTAKWIKPLPQGLHDARNIQQQQMQQGQQPGQPQVGAFQSAGQALGSIVGGMFGGQGGQQGPQAAPPAAFRTVPVQQGANATHDPVMTALGRAGYKEIEVYNDPDDGQSYPVFRIAGKSKVELDRFRSMIPSHERIAIVDENGMPGTVFGTREDELRNDSSENVPVIRYQPGKRPSLGYQGAEKPSAMPASDQPYITAPDDSGPATSVSSRFMHWLFYEAPPVAEFKSEGEAKTRAKEMMQSGNWEQVGVVEPTPGKFEVRGTLRLRRQQ